MADTDPLQQYKARRNFSVTPEPGHAGEASGTALEFVIQKHWASHLHYDFRLELDGSMKSWAVPKGPSLDPADKRMAMQVEDHPLSYAGFEGLIPAGHYGAGKVIVWDKGTWTPLGDAHRGLRDGNLKFELRGHKLHGKWALIRIKSRTGKQQPWLLIKEKDAFTRAASTFSVVDEQPDSVASLAASASKAAPARPRRAAPRAPLPAALAPQLALLASGPPPDPQDWVYEIKFDGYRILTRVQAGAARFFTRSGLDWTAKLESLRQALVACKLPDGWYDGEIVVPDARGLPDFGALQAAFDTQRSDDVLLYLFDAPYLDGRDLRAEPLDARRAQLQQVLSGVASERVRFSAEFVADAHSLVSSACKLGLEGLMAKRRDAPYVSGRSTSWIKLKCVRRQEFVIAGHTEPQGTRAAFGALVLGLFNARGVLEHVGNVGSGFDARGLSALHKKLEALASKRSPFAAAVAGQAAWHWVKPELVAEVAFSEWTRAGHIRHAVFQGLRADKAAGTVRREAVTAVGSSRAHDGAHVAKASVRPAGVQVTHAERVIDPQSGTTKIELVRYYGLVGALMMPHLKGRPVSLLRAPSGVQGELFFQKHLEATALAGMRSLAPGLSEGHPPMMEVSSAQGLAAAAQWNVVEFHTHNGIASSFDKPDRMVFDLDPGEGVVWKQVQEAAQLMHAFLLQLGLQGFLKTSGGKGLHIVVPLRRVHGWDTVKRFSQAIVAHMAGTIPQRFVARSGPKNRLGKIFIDYLRNSQGATTVAAWSARARPGLGISVPVAWEELVSLKGGDHWSVGTVHTRLDQGNAPWDGYSRSACGLAQAMKALNWSPAHP